MMSSPNTCETSRRSLPSIDFEERIKSNAGSYCCDGPSKKSSDTEVMKLCGLMDGLYN